MQNSEIKFQEGQVWKYKTRKNETESVLIILKVEKEAEEIRVHIAIDKAKIKNPRSNSGFTQTISHLPFSYKALDESVIELLHQNTELPDFSEGFNTWKQAFLQARAGVFSIPVAEAVDYVERTINQI